MADIQTIAANVSGVVNNTADIKTYVDGRFTSGIVSGAAVTSGSVQVLASNAGRQYACFVNDSDEIIYLALGTTAVVHQGIRLNAKGGAYEITPHNRFVGVVNAVHANSGNKVLCVTEGT